MYFVRSLVEDIKTKKGNRKQELELGFRLTGCFKEAESSYENSDINYPNVLVEFI